jgi:hypothetical protein
MSQKFWFTAKKKGMGWYPVSVEGWMVLGAFIAAQIAPVPRLLAGEWNVVAYLIYVAVLSTALVWVIHQKGKK